MKKNVIIIGIVFVLSFISALYFKNYTRDKEPVKQENSKQKQMVMERSLSMMLETEVGSGEYEAVTDKDWPSDGYVFNETLSSCENGGILSWDEDKKLVSMKGGISDECYVYFDKYSLPSITSYEITNTESSISISLVVQKGTNEIDKYYYSIDNGETFVDSTSSSYAFSDLQVGSYNVQAYVSDIQDKKSIVIKKDVEVLAKPTSPTFAFDSSYNVVLSGSTSENGAVEYYYSLDNTNFTKGNTVSVSQTSTVYAYSLDVKNQKSDVVSKAVTVENSTTSTVTTQYYCSKTSTYQSSSSCSYTYSATYTSSPTYKCNESSWRYPDSDGYCYDTKSYTYSTKADCLSACVSSLSSYGKVQTMCSLSTPKCWVATSQATKTYTYSYTCNSGDTVSGSTCTNTYTGTAKYKCLNTYYDTSAAATTACTNYCATGTYYNDKCYKLG